MAAAIAFPVSESSAENEGLAGPVGIVGWKDLQDIPCGLVAEIPVSGFAVRDLLLLQAGSVVNSRQLTRERVGIYANGSFVAWAEFEVVNGHVGVRLTDVGLENG